MNEERNERTIGELTTWSPNGEWPETDTREEQKAGGDWQWDPSQTIGEMETIAPEKGPGTMLLAKRYRALRRLGEGGMGSVWLAEDKKLDNRLVAIKMLPAVLAGKKGAYRQVKQEALMAMKLSHPNIATVRAFEEDEGGAPFLVMDYIEGEGLDDILSERGPLGEEEVLKLLGPVAAALDYAHSQGVVHRDVKPGNVMVRKDGTPFVLDFGIAREIQETMTRVTGKFSSGTLLYMSPEQLRGRVPKAAQDVYSFAAMAYECLAGHPPFSRGQIEYQIVNAPPEPLPEGAAGTAVRQGIMAGLAKQPEKRPGTCLGVLAKDGASRPGKPEKRTTAGAAAGITSQLPGDDAVQACERLPTEGAQRQVAEEEELDIGGGHCFRTWVAWNIDSGGILVFRWFVLSLLSGYMESDQISLLGYCMLPLVVIGLYFVFRYVAGLLLKPANRRRKEQNAGATKLSVMPSDCLRAFICYGLCLVLIGGIEILLAKCMARPDNAGASLWGWRVIGAIANYLLFRHVAVPMLLASVRKQIASPAGPLAEERAPERRGHTAEWAAGLVLTLVAAVGIGWWWQNGRTQPEEEELDVGGVGDHIGQFQTGTVFPELQTPLRDHTTPSAPSATVSGQQGPSGDQEVVGSADENPAGTDSGQGGGLDYEKVRRAAEQGDAVNQNLLGVLYKDGEGVEQNDEEAVAWFRKAAEQGNASAQNNLGWMYDEGRGVPQSDTEAVSWYRKAAEQGEAMGQNNLGGMYAEGRGVPQSDTEAVSWYRKAAEQGEAMGQYNLGVMYAAGRGVTQSDTEAVSWYRKASEQGNALAKYKLGEMYENGRGVPQSDVEAASWYRQAAEQGVALGQYKLGMMYQIGQGVAQSDAAAVSWYRQAAEQGEAWGQVLLGAMYSDGRGVLQSDTDAVSWYRKAAKQGNTLALCYLGEMYENGRGVPQGYAEATVCYRRAAEQGDASGQRKLGLMYQTGRGVAQSDAEAASWYRKAAEQGEEWGQVLLGAMYNDGQGVPQSDAEAVLWFRKAAEQGNALGQRCLGEMYEVGRGVPQSDAEAASWYRKAASQGDEEAKEALERMGLM